MNSPVAPSQLLDVSAKRSDGLRDPGIGEVLRRWAELRPETLAFLHKRRGRWHAFSRSYVAREVERLAALLKERSNSGEIRLAASGDYEPDLVILGLAALSVGGEVFLLHDILRGEALARELAAIRPTLAFVQGRRAIAQWLAAAPSGTARLPLFSTRAFAGGNSAWDVVPLHDAVTLVAASRPRRLWPWPAWSRLADIAWIDEGTEWREGMRRLIDSALHDGLAIAFPETAESAVRDRRQLQPASLILSPARQRRLEEEDRARRAPEGSFSRRLVDHAETSSGGIARFVNHRRNVVLGLGRIRPLASAEPISAPAPVSA
jgi:hypothetical protein